MLRGGQVTGLWKARRAGGGLVLLALGAQLLAVAAGGEADAASSRKSGSRPAVPSGMVAVPSRDSNLLPALVPVLKRLGRAGQQPLLVVLGGEAAGKAPVFVRRVKPERCLIVSTAGGDELPWAGHGLAVERLVLPAGRTAAALELARCMWTRSETAVVSLPADPGAEIVGSTLAAHMGVPYLPLDGPGAVPLVSKVLAGLGVRRVLLTLSAYRRPPPWTAALRPCPEVLDRKGANRLMVGVLGREGVRNLIVLRAPVAGARPPWTETAWAAPYLALARGSMVVVCENEDGRRTEAGVARVIRDNALRPRSVTLLGDDELIGNVEVGGDRRLGEYSLQIEPCSGFPARGAASLAVGRIPCRMLSQAVKLISTTLAAERAAGSGEPRVVMVANPASVGSRLPLCETISRLSAAEFSNRGVRVGEFYGSAPADERVIESTRTARLIFYQGHSSDQTIFEVPWLPWEGNGNDYVGEVHPDERYPGETEIMPAPAPAPAPATQSPPGAEDHRAQVPEEHAGGETARPSLGEAAAQQGPGEDVPSEAERLSASEAAFEGVLTQEERLALIEARLRLAKVKSLDGMPVVFLQSCSSLDPLLAQSIFDSGGVGLIGSVTGIHSASGASFAKAFSDGLLGRDSTVGEALRDARNYFLCLGELKSARGHKQGSKAYRVALSFRLLGDPEARLGVARGGAAAPGLQAVAAEFGSPGEITVRVPKRRLPEARTDKYVGQFFPGSQAAGIVRSVKGKAARRLMPLYFFRLDAPRGFGAGGVSISFPVQPPDRGPRSVLMTDSFGRYAYLLHLPERERRGETVNLKLPPDRTR